MKLLCILFTLISSASFGYAEDCETIPKDVTQDGVIEFSPYPVPIGSACKYYTWQVSVDGYNVDFTVDYLELDAVAGDHLIISPGSSLTEDGTSSVMTGKITSRKFRMMNSGEMFVMLVTQNRTEESGNFKGIKLSYEPYGNITTEAPSTTPIPTLPTAPNQVDDEATLYVAGIKPKAFIKKMAQFKEKMATMANEYCLEKNITLLKPTLSDNVVLDLITSCPITWTDWETCTKIQVILPVFVELSSKYELTGYHIEEMWKTQGDQIASLGMQPYLVPDSDEAMLIWVYIALGVVAVFAAILLTAWKTDVFSSNNKKASQFDPLGRVSELSTDSWISITNSYQTYQEVPPLFYDENIEKPTMDAAPHTLTVPEDEKPRLSEEFRAAMLFGNRGYDNPSFDAISEEILDGRKENQVDDFSSDEEMPSNTQTTMSNQNQLHHRNTNNMTQIGSSFMDENNESAL